jgi:branched-chain amino acid transport system substrate-binding protein
MLLRAMHAVQSTAVQAVAARMSGMLFEGFNGPVQMRPVDHQLQKGVFVSRWVRHVPGQGRDAEGTGWQFVPVAYAPPDELREPTRCVMNRPDY